MKIIRLVLGAFATNTYIIISGGQAFVIDPAAEAEKILAVIAENEACLVAVLLTHGHFDHTSAAQELRLSTSAKIYIHENDAPMLNDLKKSFASFIPKMFKPCKADVFLKDGDVINIGGESEESMQMQVVTVPGHSAGSIMYILDDVIFTGDTLFAGSVGRIDGWGGDGNAQAQSLEKIKAMTGNYRIFPGHGDETTLEIEKQTNPYLI